MRHNRRNQRRGLYKESFGAIIYKRTVIPIEILRITFFLLLFIVSAITFIRIYHYVCEKIGVFKLLDILWKSIAKRRE